MQLRGRERRCSGSSSGCRSTRSTGRTRAARTRRRLLVAQSRQCLHALLALTIEINQLHARNHTTQQHRPHRAQCRTHEPDSERVRAALAALARRAGLDGRRSREAAGACCALCSALLCCPSLLSSLSSSSSLLTILFLHMISLAISSACAPRVMRSLASADRPASAEAEEATDMSDGERARGAHWQAAATAAASEAQNRVFGEV